MILLLKACCLALYLGGLCSLLLPLPWPLRPWLELASLFVLVVHALQVPLAWRYVRRCPGTLGLSVLQTLLFGVLHWVPVAWASRRAGHAEAASDAA